VEGQRFLVGEGLLLGLVHGGLFSSPGAAARLFVGKARNLTTEGGGNNRPTAFRLATVR
jgi:hypothetical protein